MPNRRLPPDGSADVMFGPGVVAGRDAAEGQLRALESIELLLVLAQLGEFAM